MQLLEYYLKFCRKFRKIKVPELKFKELSKAYSIYAKKEYNISQTAINKTTFFIFILILITTVLLSVILSTWNLYFLILISLSISLILSYLFNTIIIKKISSVEKYFLNHIYFIKIDYTLIMKTFNKYNDPLIRFIELMLKYDDRISAKFKKIYSKIHLGKSPEHLIRSYISPSKDFNKLINDLLVSNFQNIDVLLNNEIMKLEEDFKIHLEQISSKLSVIFFVGIFIPLGIYFVEFFLVGNKYLIIFTIPIFIFFLNLLFKKFINIDHQLLSVLDSFSQNNQMLFDEFIMFIKLFGNYLKNEISQEKALFLVTNDSHHYFKLLTPILKELSAKLITGNSNFEELFNHFKEKLNNIRYTLIIGSIINILKLDSRLANEKINDLITVIRNHQKLENELDLIIKAQKFKIFLFIFLLPFITGAFSGLLPLIANFDPSIIQMNINFNTFQSNFNINGGDIILVLIHMICNNSISSFYFLKIIKSKSRIFYIILSDVIQILVFLITVMNTLSFLN